MADRNFVRKKVKSLTLGEKLRQLREDRHMRVQDLSRKVNIKSSYIVALESGVYDDLPTKVYTKGFVRSYARFFGVPEDVLLNLFEREYSVHKNISNKDEEETVSRLPKVPRFVFTPRILLAILSFIVLSGIGVYLYFGIDSFISSPWLVVEQPANNSVVHEDTIMVSGKTRSNSKVSINGQQVFVDIDGAFSDQISLAPGVNVIHVNSVNRFNKESSKEIVVDAQYEIEEKSEEVSVQSTSVFIKAQNEPVWINVVADGVDIYNDTIQLDDEREFSAANSIVITTSSGKNTLFSYDNEQYKSIGNEDAIVQNWTYAAEEKEVPDNSDSE